MNRRHRPEITAVPRLLRPLGLAAPFARPAALWAHEGRAVAPHDVWTAWSGEPVVLLGIFAAALAYAVGVRRLWRRAGIGRGLRRWQAGAFAGGVAALFIALVSPLDALGSTLFSAHMLQHVVLVAVAAPLLVLGRPLVPLVWALPRNRRPAIGRVGRTPAVRLAWRSLTHPLTAWALHAAALWTWHAPRLYQATLESDLVHAAQHGSFLGTALLFWWSVIYPRGPGGTGYGTSILSVFTTAVHNSALGALLVFARTHVYPVYADTTAMWSLTPLEDQQLGGLIMWVPAGVVFLAAALLLFTAWLDAADRARARRERPRHPPSDRASETVAAG